MMSQSVARTPISHGDLGDEPKMARDKVIGGFTIAVLAPAGRKGRLLLGPQNGKLADFSEPASSDSSGTDAVPTAHLPSIRQLVWLAFSRNDLAQGAQCWPFATLQIYSALSASKHAENV
jgi:hypothetical protein